MLSAQNRVPAQNTISAPNMISPQIVAELIAQGEPVVVHEGYALNISKWIDNHPGGRLAILHMVGRDATDEINMYALPRPWQLRSLIVGLWDVGLTQFAAATIPTKPFL